MAIGAKTRRSSLVLNFFNAYLQDLKPGKTQYAWQRIRDVVDGLDATVTTHLEDEIATLQASDKHEGKIHW
jgi:hypothetical protein